MLSLRPYRAEDRAACAAVFFRAVREGAAAFYDEAQRAAWAPGGPAPGLDRLKDQWCLVAERDGAVVGFMAMTPAGYLDMTYVLPEEMGRGTAGMLYDALLARARATGLSHLTVHASHLARPFLERRGWRVDAPEEVTRNGAVLARFAMSLALPAPTDARA